MTSTRKESDSLGEVEVPADALYGAQTQRAVDNFPISGSGMPVAFIKALVLVKSVAARVNGELGEIDHEKAASIREACDALLARADLLEHFPRLRRGECVLDSMRVHDGETRIQVPSRSTRSTQAEPLRVKPPYVGGYATLASVSVPAAIAELAELIGAWTNSLERAA